MKTKLHHLTEGQWKASDAIIDAEKCQLVLVFGSSELIIDPNNFEYLKNIYPNADIVSASTAGEIIQANVCDNTIVATAIQLENSELKSGI